jgi:hypothetical protein
MREPSPVARLFQQIADSSPHNENRVVWATLLEPCARVRACGGWPIQARLWLEWAIVHAMFIRHRQLLGSPLTFSSCLGG